MSEMKSGGYTVQQQQEQVGALAQASQRLGQPQFQQQQLIAL